MKSILIIDDEINARDLLAHFIQRQGFTALTASSGEEGIEIYRDKKPDLVLLDILLPGIDGEHVLQYIREISPAASVYFMTGCDDLLTHEKALEMGARGIFIKPLYFETIAKLLDTMDNGGSLEKTERPAS